MNNFWKSLPKSFTVLAPMDGVTDSVFRQVVLSCSRPDVFFTEFISTDGLCSKGRDKLKDRLMFTPEEKPLVAQIWGSNPENFFQSAKYLAELGFDGIDINMGCPDSKVVKAGAGAASILNLQMAKEVIEATKRGAPNLPVSVKTRIGFNEIQTESWIEFLLQQDLAALTVHGRTAKEKSEPAAHWEEIAKAVEIRDNLGVSTLIIGNGDVKSLAEVSQKASRYGVDGVMIGRGVFENIWVFNPQSKGKTPEEKLQVLHYHLQLFTEVWNDKKHFEPLKKFFKIYVNGFPGASALRAKLMETHSAEEVKAVLEKSF